MAGFQTAALLDEQAALVKRRRGEGAEVDWWAQLESTLSSRRQLLAVLRRLWADMGSAELEVVRDAVVSDEHPNLLGWLYSSQASLARNPLAVCDKWYAQQR